VAYSTDLANLGCLLHFTTRPLSFLLHTCAQQILPLSSGARISCSADGSSPYQKIHSSLPNENSVGLESECFTTRLQTHSMSACRHRAYELSTGSSSGSSLVCVGSMHSFLHLMPQMSVWKKRQKYIYYNKK